MKPVRETRTSPPEDFRPSRLILAILASTLLAILLGVLSKVTRRDAIEPPALTSTGSLSSAPATHSLGPAPRVSSRKRPEFDNSQTEQEIVANKVIKFGRIRRELVHAIAKHFRVEVPDDVERFFDAVENSRWEEVDAAHQALLLDEKQLNQPRSAELHEIWRPIQETWGAAREAHNWPAQRLLDYGNAILGSLRPGMIYAGGTDPGCFIPTMLNETGEGERHIVLTQNALADMTYLKYLDFLYGDQMATLTEEDSQRAFNEYLADAQKRLQHDQQNPDEPKQLKPGEDVKVIENRVQVSGQVAVMAINERLFQTLMSRNPNASFAMEESFPFASMYATATPLGPVMEMGVQDKQNPLTAERATQSVDYWRDKAQQLLSDPETPEGSDARKAFSKLISSQAGLLQDRKFTAEAEQAFRLANEICPASPEAVFRYVNLLMAQNRIADALPVVEGAMKAAPDDKQFQDLLNQLKARQASDRP